MLFLYSDVPTVPPEHPMQFEYVNFLMIGICYLIAACSIGYVAFSYVTDCKKSQTARQTPLLTPSPELV